MSQLEVFWGSGSQPAWAVLLTLEVKRIPYVSRLLSFSAGEHKTPEFLAMNRRHKVPVIKDGEFVLNESTAIMAYLDRKAPEPPLFGRDAQDTGRVWRAISEFQHYVMPGLLDNVVRPIYSNKVEEQRAAIEGHLPALHAELALLETSLSTQPWLVGSSLSAADLLIFPYFMSLMRAATRPAAASLTLGMLPLASTYPALAAWVARIEAIPGYDKTYPPHWR
ncbi:MAG: glutathione S-transferase family protein [Polyangiaceae bacterium]